MRCELLSLGAGDNAAALAAEVRALAPAPEIGAGDGDRDHRGRPCARGRSCRPVHAAVRYQRCRVAGASGCWTELRASAQRLHPAVRAGLELAIDNVRRVAQARLAPDRLVEFGGHQVALREVPVARAAVYVPGGRAPYPSTVVMGVVTAKTAGVAEIVVCSPPAADGEVDRAIEAACSLTGATEVYRMGGAQAIAALALRDRDGRPGRRDRRARQPLRAGGQAAGLRPGRDRRIRRAERSARDRRRRCRHRADRA